jgi:mono/diheme cytochrome c family protein
MPGRLIRINGSHSATPILPAVRQRRGNRHEGDIRMKKTILLAVALAALPLTGRAQDADIGQTEYTNSCAQCHGAAGKGDGSMAGLLMTQPTDLTQVQKANGGVFPVKRLYGVIDGTTAVGLHGTAEMPAWGMRYSLNAPEALGPLYATADKEAFVRGRILALVEYISTLQAQ